MRTGGIYVRGGGGQGRRRACPIRRRLASVAILNLGVNNATRCETLGRPPAQTLPLTPTHAHSSPPLRPAPPIAFAARICVSRFTPRTPPRAPTAPASTRRQPGWNATHGRACFSPVRPSSYRLRALFLSAPYRSLPWTHPPPPHPPPSSHPPILSCLLPSSPPLLRGSPRRRRCCFHLFRPIQRLAEG